MASDVTIYYSKHFLKRARKLSLQLQNKIEERELIFRNDPFTPSLETHKLHGKDRDSWAYSIDNKHRIKFVFINGHTVLYLDVGTHDEVY